MVRKVSCLICAFSMVLAMGTMVRAVESPGSIDAGQAEMIRQPKLIYVGEQPRTADRPAPIIGAMGIGLSAAVLMVLADRRK